MLGHQPTFLWQSICVSLMTHGLCGFWNALFHIHRFNSCGWPVGSSVLLEIAYSRLYWSLRNEFLLLCVCLLGFAMFLHIRCVLRFEGLDSKECTLPGFDGDPPSQSSLSLSKSNVEPRKFASEVTVEKARGSPSPPLHGTALPAVANAVLPSTLMDFCSFIALLFALNHLLMFPN